MILKDLRWAWLMVSVPCYRCEGSYHVAYHCGEEAVVKHSNFTQKLLVTGWLWVDIWSLPFTKQLWPRLSHLPSLQPQPPFVNENNNANVTGLLLGVREITDVYSSLQRLAYNLYAWQLLILELRLLKGRCSFQSWLKNLFKIFLRLK